jgi:gamma-glutamyltranspeptidase / glutathione hydrolase
VEARWFADGCVATPHHLASAAGHTVLASGGNAVDAAVAANLVLAVVTPYHCGVGGDLLAIVWDGRATGVASTGAAPAGATPEAIRAAIDDGHGDPTRSLPDTAGMPTFGALPVTVPGAVAGWFDLLARWGTRSFGDLAAAAIRAAEHGFPVSPHGAVHPERAGRSSPPSRVGPKPTGGCGQANGSCSRTSPRRFGRWRRRDLTPSTAGRSRRASSRRCRPTGRR